MRSGYEIGKLITIEGIDGVGKNTQAVMLRDYLAKEYGDCGLFSFPRYDTPTGKLVRAYLNGELGELNILQRLKLYADDRLAAREEILDYLFRGYDVICDRYVDSNLAFFKTFAQMESDAQRNYDTCVSSYITRLEYEINQMPKANATFVLRMNVEDSHKLMQNRYSGDESKKDGHERNIELLTRTSDYYRSIRLGYNTNKDTKDTCYYPIECGDLNGGIRSIDSIHQEILKTTKQFINNTSWLG